MVDVSLFLEGTLISEMDDQNYARFLSSFQIEKFTYMFKNFFDSSADKGGDGVIDKADVEDFLERMRIFRDFTASDPRYVSMKDVLYAFYDCLKDQVEREIRASATSKGFDKWSEALAPRNKDHHEVTLNQWLNMWGRLCRGAAGISGFPFWVQLLAHIFFDALDYNSDGFIDFDEYKRFYTFVGVKAENLDKVADEGYRSLTAVSRETCRN
jgi:Ca2+-binding EF-hand superfamily protein